MRLFRLIPEILKYSTADEFVREINPCEKDFVFISKSTYDAYFKDKLAPATVAFKGDYIKGEPTDESVNRLIADFMKKPYERVIAIGGGSVIDMAKLLVVTDGGDIVKVFKRECEIKKMRELVAVPTTCGAGSEVSNISILDVKEMQSKFGLAVDEIFPDSAVILGELMSNLPDSFFITSAIDGLIHSIESYVSAKSNIYTELFGEKSIECYIKGFKRIAKEGIAAKQELLEEFLIASNMAGIAFSNTGTGAVHAISYPVSGKYHVTHGEANALFLTPVLKMYEEKDNATKLTQLKAFMAKSLECDTADAVQALSDLLGEVIELPALHSYGMTEEEISLFADSVVKNQQRLLSNSYVPLNSEDIKRVYKSIF